jgi:hypothetical protein
LKTADQGCRSPYWDSELGKLHKAARRSWNERQSDPDAYHLAVKTYDKALRAAKRKSWRTFYGEVYGIIPFARLHKVLSKDVSYQVGALRLLSGDFTSSNGEAAQHLLMNHFSGCQLIEEPNSSRRVLEEPAQEDWDLASEVVSEDKVSWAIDDFGTFKAAGEDGIFPGLLQHGIEIIIRPVRVIFIPKPGRDSYELVKSFTPTGLTSFFLKMMERRVDSYIRAGPLKSFPLIESQYAYERGRSTESALHDLVQKIERA